MKNVQRKGSLYFGKDREVRKVGNSLESVGYDSLGRGDSRKMGGAVSVPCDVSAGFGGEKATGGLGCIRRLCAEHK